MLAPEEFPFYPDSDLTGSDQWNARSGLAAVINAACGRPAIHGRPLTDRRWSLGDVVVKRLFSLAETVRGGPTYPIAHPTYLNGTIEPDDFVARLAAAHRANIEPAAIELGQALVRLELPSELRDRREMAGRLAAVPGAAARRAADWVSSAAPRAWVRVDTPTPDDRGDHTYSGLPQPTLAGTVRPDGPVEEAGQIWIDAMAVRGFVHSWDPKEWERGFWVVPRHREVAAASILDQLSSSLDSSTPAAAALPALADLVGPVGETTATAMILGAASSRAEARAQACEAMHRLDGAGLFDDLLFGELIGRYVTQKVIVLGRVASTLRELSGRAALPTWRTIRATLPELLTSEPPPAGLADLLALAAEVVERTGSQGQVAQLDAFAARTGRSRQLVEARRLRELLTAR